jgi:hypothetical protein
MKIFDEHHEMLSGRGPRRPPPRPSPRNSRIAPAKPALELARAVA